MSLSLTLINWLLALAPVLVVVVFFCSIVIIHLPDRSSESAKLPGQLSPQ